MSASGKQRRGVVLLVEDNAADVFLVQEAIELYRLQLDLHIAVDGEQAYRFIERAEDDPEHAPRPDVMILDLNLPKRSGREVLGRLRRSASCSAVAVLIMTSSDLLSDRKELSALGATRYFCKPSGYDAFLKVGGVLKELLEEHAPRHCW